MPKEVIVYAVQRKSYNVPWEQVGKEFSKLEDAEKLLNKLLTYQEKHYTKHEFMIIKKTIEIEVIQCATKSLWSKET